MLPERLSREVIYESGWVNLYADRVRFPAGRIVERHHVVDVPNPAVGVVVENDRGQLLLVEAYRYVNQSTGWEIPAGGVDPGEDLLEAARREVAEETGCAVKNCRRIHSYHPSNGLSTQLFHVVTARAASGIGRFDANEVRSVRWFDCEAVTSMIRGREIADGFSLTALLLYLFIKDA
jgi:ADP-ribose pyrophosphatase